MAAGLVWPGLIVCVLVYVTQCTVVNWQQWEECCLGGSTECKRTAETLLPGTYDEDRYKRICQRYNKDHYATFYDTTNRIPVFSMASYTGTGGRRPKVAFCIEPQLETPNGSREMEEEQRKKTYRNQATNADYARHDVYNRGHLIPQMYFQSPDRKKATFTLTNVIPQRIDLNGGCWGTVEKKIGEFIRNRRCENDNSIAVGAVPGPDNHRGRVNIPSYVWSYFRCGGQCVLGFVLPNNHNQTVVQRDRLLTVHHFPNARQFLDQVQKLYQGQVRSNTELNRRKLNNCNGRKLWRLLNGLCPNRRRNNQRQRRPEQQSERPEQQSERPGQQSERPGQQSERSRS